MLTAAPLAETDTTPDFTYTLRQTGDADEHAACLTNWQQNYDQLSPGTFLGEFEEFCFGKVQLFRETLNQTVHQTGLAWSGSRTFGVQTSISGRGWFGGEEYVEGSMLTLADGAELDFRTPEQLEILAYSANAAALNQYAQEVEDRDLEAELHQRSIINSTTEQIENFTGLLAVMFDSLRATPRLLHYQAIRDAMEQGLFAAVLDVMPTQPPHSISSRSRQLIVTRAREYMEAHIDQPITVAELCRELGVSRRTLQYSFQDVLDLSPVRFLCVMRLNAVRRTLKHAADNELAVTVADIAASWGFWHLSHFSANYKALFGELPSETLQRGK